MAKARKCDRCGTCFDPLDEIGEMTRFQNPIFQNAQSIRETRVLRRLIESEGPDTWIDLCPKCTQAFEKFMAAPPPLTEMEPPLTIGREPYEKLQKLITDPLTVPQPYVQRDYIEVNWESKEEPNRE